ncbi:conserved hypothetical protein [Gammaproteobacteria bacterium]
MNALTAQIRSTPTALTANGARTFVSTKSPIVDLFFLIGSANLKTTPVAQLASMFEAAFEADEDRAVRMLLWTRDIREGAGRREVFRKMMLYLARNRQELCIRILPYIPELGRWDDLLIFSNDPELVNVEQAALAVVAKGLSEKNALCAKWMPRTGLVAGRLREFLALGNNRHWTKLLARLSETVEQQMSARLWEEINYSHVPSLASIRYAKAFHRHDKERYEKWRDDLKRVRTAAPETLTKEDKKIKVNVGAVYPHDIVHAVRSGDATTANEQWERLPNFLGDNSVLPIVDVSGSMDVKVQGPIRAMDISIALGMYCASKGTGPFQNIFMTFSSEPEWVDLKGASTLQAKIEMTRRAPWGMSTDLDASLALLLSTAVKARVPAEDMPKTLLIISDMEFNSCGRLTNYQAIQARYDAAGYSMPQVVFWNVNPRQGNNPVQFDARGVALVSGFSPTILKSVLSGTGLSPIDMVDAVIMKERYNINSEAA